MAITQSRVFINPIIDLVYKANEINKQFRLVAREQGDYMWNASIYIRQDG